MHLNEPMHYSFASSLNLLFPSEMKTQFVTWFPQSDIRETMNHKIIWLEAASVSM